MSWLRENLGLKLFALLLAILLEIYFYSPDNSITVDLTAHVELRNMPSSKMVVSPVGGIRNLTISFTARGPEPIVQRLKRESLSYIIQLPPALGDSYLEYVRPDLLTLGASGVQVLDFQPAVIDLEFDAVIRKELLVVVQQRGDLAEGHLLKKLNVRPVSVIARGPAAELRGVEVVETKLVSLDGLADRLQAEVALVPPGANTRLDVNVVNVDVQASPILEEKRFTDVPVAVRSKDAVATSLEPGKVTAYIRGPVSALNALKMDAINLSVDVAGLENGQKQLPVLATLPEGLSLLRTDPETVRVTVSRDTAREAPREQSSTEKKEEKDVIRN